MPTSSRFAVAVHILAGLATNDGQPLTSEEIAKSASTNPVVIRRILSMLNAAGFSHSQMGQGGGALLSKKPDTISLLEVFRTVENEELFALHRSCPDQDCAVGRHIQPVLQSTIDRALGALEAELSKVSIADVAKEIVRRDKRARS